MHPVEARACLLIEGPRELGERQVCRCAAEARRAHMHHVPPNARHACVGVPALHRAHGRGHACAWPGYEMAARRFAGGDRA